MVLRQNILQRYIDNNIIFLNFELHIIPLSFNSDSVTDESQISQLTLNDDSRAIINFWNFFISLASKYS
jgi:hypothetical protein